MHADKHRLVAVFDIASNQRHVRLTAVHFTFVRNQAELAMLRSNQCTYRSCCMR